jgi:hypothetical protein
LRYPVRTPADASVFFFFNLVTSDCVVRWRGKYARDLRYPVRTPDDASVFFFFNLVSTGLVGCNIFSFLFCCFLFSFIFSTNQFVGTRDYFIFSFAFFDFFIFSRNTAPTN